MTNIPYDPILHDLSISPRNMTSAEIVQYWLGDLSFVFLSNITGWDFRYVSVQGCYTMEPNSTNC